MKMAIRLKKLKYRFGTMQSCHSTGAIALRGRLNAGRGGLLLCLKKDLERITETMDEKHGSGERYRERFAETTRTV
jgi:hypothetical protein